MDRKADFWSVYKAFWKKSFDFQGTATLREYWLPTALHLEILALAVVFYLVFKPEGWGLSALVFYLILVYLLIGLVPWVALTLRRIRDTGLSGLWALLLLFVGAGTFVVLALCAAGHGAPSPVQPSVALYGPPPIEESSFDPRNNTVPALYGPPPIEESSFKPSDNMTPTLYGPPATQPQTKEKETEEESGTVPPSTFAPSNNTAAPLYGPPPSQGK